MSASEKCRRRTGRRCRCATTPLTTTPRRSSVRQLTTLNCRCRVALHLLHSHMHAFHQHKTYAHHTLPSLPYLTGGEFKFNIQSKGVVLRNVLEQARSNSTLLSHVSNVLVSDISCIIIIIIIIKCIYKAHFCGCHKCAKKCRRRTGRVVQMEDCSRQLGTSSRNHAPKLGCCLWQNVVRNVQGVAVSNTEQPVLLDYSAMRPDI